MGECDRSEGGQKGTVKGPLAPLSSSRLAWRGSNLGV